MTHVIMYLDYIALAASVISVEALNALMHLKLANFDEDQE